MFTRMFAWLSYIREVLYCHCDERSAERPLGSDTAAKQHPNTLLVKRHWLTRSHDVELWYVQQ